LSGFEHAEAVEGYIKGYKRVFWQGSTGVRAGFASATDILLQSVPSALSLFQNSISAEIARFQQ
jgi:hypothetical protein